MIATIISPIIKNVNLKQCRGGMRLVISCRYACTLLIIIRNNGQLNACYVFKGYDRNNYFSYYQQRNRVQCRDGTRRCMRHISRPRAVNQGPPTIGRITPLVSPVWPMLPPLGVARI